MGARHPQLRDQASTAPPPPKGDGPVAQPSSPSRGNTANRPAQMGPPKVLPHVRMNQIKAKLEQCEQYVRQQRRQSPSQSPVGPREAICQLGPAAGNGPTPPRHGRSRHRQSRQQDAGASREQEVGAYEADIEGLKEAVAAMCRGLTMFGDYARHQVDRVPYFAPPLNFNQLTQTSHGPPSQSRFISDPGEGEGRVNVIQTPRIDVPHVMNKEKKGGEHTNAR